MQFSQLGIPDDMKLRIFFSHSSPNPVMTLLTIITAATPSITPRIDTHVMTEATDRLGLRYLKARNAEKPNAMPSLCEGRHIHAAVRRQMSTDTLTSFDLSIAFAPSASSVPSSAPAFTDVVGR